MFMEKSEGVTLQWCHFWEWDEHSVYYTFSKFFTISFTLNFPFLKSATPPHVAVLHAFSITPKKCFDIVGLLCDKWWNGTVKGVKKELFLNHIITRLTCVRCWAASSTETEKSQAYWTCPSSSHTHMHMHTASKGFRRSRSHISASNGWVHSYSDGEMMTMALISSISPWTMGGIHSMLVCAFITGRTC